MYRKILVPLDGSPTAECILSHARALALSEGAEIILLNVVPGPALEFAFADPTIAARSLEEQEASGRQYMQSVQTELEASGFKVSSLFGQGSPAEGILSVAEQLQVDVIAMSTHGRSGPARWLLGSVAEHVVRHSGQPVLMVRAGV